MSTIWLQVPSINAVPYRIFLTKGRHRVLAAILVADDGRLYFSYSRKIAGMIKELVLGSPFLDRSTKRYLVFRAGKCRIKTDGYLILARTNYELDLFTEEVRKLIEASINRPVKVRKLKTREELQRIEKELTEEEKKIFELAPLDIPEELLEEEIEGEEIIIKPKREDEGEQ